jgi:uncharacterized protein involved in exopolysaccharide biosynthesis
MNDEAPPSGPGSPDVSLEVRGDSGRRTWAFYAQPNESPADEAGGGLDLFEMLDLLRRGLPNMTMGALALAALGGIYLLLAEPIYDVGAQVLVQRRAVLANQGETPSGTGLFLATQAEIISSPSVVASALDALPEPPERSIGEAGDSVEAVASLVSATPIKGTSVLALTYIGPSAWEGLSILDAVIESYRRFVREIDHADHRKDVVVLAEHEAELRQQLDELVARYSKMHSENAVAGEGQDVASMNRSLIERLSSELVAARARRIKLENERFALDEHGHLSGDRQESQSRERLVEQIWRAEVKAVELRAQYADDHLSVREANEQLTALRRELWKLKRRERAALEGEVAAAHSTEARLNEAYRAELEAAKTIEARHFERTQLKDEIDRLAESHQVALATLRNEKLTQQGREEGRAMVAIHVLEPPNASESPLWPRPPLVLAPCVAIGALLGLAGTWLRDWWRASTAERAFRSTLAPHAIERAKSGPQKLRSAGRWVGSGDAGSA